MALVTTAMVGIILHHQSNDAPVRHNALRLVPRSANRHISSRDDRAGVSGPAVRYHPGDAFAYILEGTMLLEIVGKESEAPSGPWKLTVQRRS